jgi:hypothetical protein
LASIIVGVAVVFVMIAIGSGVCIAMTKPPTEDIRLHPDDVDLADLHQDTDRNEAP